MTWVQTTVLLPAEISLQTRGNCPKCGRHVIVKKKWAEIKREVRRQIAKEFAEARGRNLCERCYGEVRKAGNLADYDRLDMPADIFVEEYVTLHQSGATDDQIRHVLKMTPAAFDQALRRARKARQL